ncbi:hypothetical protein CCR75_006386 [Bremia lactucae]|uniref:RxLR effector protein n=1 Tax=Bremia lactucae TaxID=4779 RepID=A0A976FND2_BRELC|nr:hypothetical protein CCR75_006386 [Bremia lactucae]
MRFWYLYTALLINAETSSAPAESATADATMFASNTHQIVSNNVASNRFLRFEKQTSRGDEDRTFGALSGVFTRNVDLLNKLAPLVHQNSLLVQVIFKVQTWLYAGKSVPYIVQELMSSLGTISFLLHLDMLSQGVKNLPVKPNQESSKTITMISREMRDIFFEKVQLTDFGENYLDMIFLMALPNNAGYTRSQQLVDELIANAVKENIHPADFAIMLQLNSIDPSEANILVLGVFMRYLKSLNHDTPQLIIDLEENIGQVRLAMLLQAAKTPFDHEQSSIATSFQIDQFKIWQSNRVNIVLMRNNLNEAEFYGTGSALYNNFLNAFTVYVDAVSQYIEMASVLSPNNLLASKQFQDWSENLLAKFPNDQAIVTKVLRHIYTDDELFASLTSQDSALTPTSQYLLEELMGIWAKDILASPRTGFFANRENNMYSLNAMAKYIDIMLKKPTITDSDLIDILSLDNLVANKFRLDITGHIKASEEPINNYELGVFKRWRAGGCTVDRIEKLIEQLSSDGKVDIHKESLADTLVLYKEYYSSLNYEMNDNDIRKEVSNELIALIAEAKENQENLFETTAYVRWSTVLQLRFPHDKVIKIQALLGVYGDEELIALLDVPGNTNKIWRQQLLGELVAFWVDENEGTAILKIMREISAKTQSPSIPLLEIFAKYIALQSREENKMRLVANGDVGGWDLLLAKAIQNAIVVKKSNTMVDLQVAQFQRWVANNVDYKSVQAQFDEDPRKLLFSETVEPIVRAYELYNIDRNAFLVNVASHMTPENVESAINLEQLTMWHDFLAKYFPNHQYMFS